MIKTLIVEDNKKSAELLKRYVSNLFCDIESTLQATKNSAIDYILKPYDIKELKNAVKAPKANRVKETVSKSAKPPNR